MSYLLTDEAIDKLQDEFEDKECENCPDSYTCGGCTARDKFMMQAQHAETLRQLEKEGMLRCDFTIQRGKNRCYRKTCRRCAALREVA